MRSVPLVLVAALTLGAWSPATAQSWKSVTMSQQLTREGPLDVRVSYGAGRLTIAPSAGDLLYRMSLRYDADRFEPLAELEEDRLRLGVQGVGGRFEEAGGELDLVLSDEVEMALDLEFGAVRADVDVGGLSLSSLELTTGASDARLDVSRPNPVRMESARLSVGVADFTASRLGNLNAARITVDAGVGNVRLGLDGEWRGDTSVAIDMGLGALEIRIPRGLGVRLDEESFLTSVDADGMEKRGDSYYSPGWDDAEHRVTLDVDAAFGAIRVVWIG